VKVKDLIESVEKSTSDCRTFLAEFFKKTPDLITGIYGGADGEEVLKAAVIPKNWKRRSKGKPGGTNSQLSGDTYYVWEEGKPYPKGPSYYKGVPLKASEVLNERIFVLCEETYEDGVIFLVLETKDGNLFVSEYLGD
jgi:hypothetical protein